MSSFEQHKMMSIKLATLSKRDQKWVLKHLPQERREDISKGMTFVNQFKINNVDLLFQSLLEEGNASTQHEHKVQQVSTLSLNLNHHLVAIVEGRLKVTNEILNIVNKYVGNQPK